MKREMLTFAAGALAAWVARSPEARVEVGWDFDEKGRKEARVELAQHGDGAWVREGTYERWYANGNLHMRGSLRADREEGVWHKYHENGQLKKRLAYSRGEIHGRYESWYPNGQKSSEGEFDRGSPTGSWTVWNEDGSIDAERTGRYVDGELVRDGG